MLIVKKKIMSQETLSNKTDMDEYWAKCCGQNQTESRAK